MPVELARREWEDGYRRLEAAADDPRGYARLVDQVEAVTDELRRRVGGAFTLAELAEAYASAERWATEAIAERDGRPGWIVSASTATAAAFHTYARAAQDYRP